MFQISSIDVFIKLMQAWLHIPLYVFVQGTMTLYMRFYYMYENNVSKLIWQYMYIQVVHENHAC